VSGFASGMSQMMQGSVNEAAAGNASADQQNMGWQGINTANQVYNKDVGALQPWIQTGTNATNQLNQNAGPNGSLGRQFTMADFNKDPAYQFDVQQGLQAINNSNSVRGGALSGGTLKALSNYGTQQASNEFGNAAARFTQNQNQNFGQLSSLAGQGLSAVNTQANVGTNYANANMAQLNNIGNAQAQGVLGQAAGKDQAIGGFFGAAGSLATMGMGS